MMTDAYDLTEGPVTIRWPKTAAPSVGDDQVGRGLRGRKVRSGSRVCLIGIGKMLAAASEAATFLEADNINATVWDPRVVKPLDPAMLADAAGHDLVITIEDGLLHGGIGSEIAQRIGSATQVKVLGVPTEYLPHGKPDAILTQLGLDGEGIANTVRSALVS